MQRNQIRTQMPRQSRKKSSTGIYHVMLRGINKQDIFEEEEDYVKMKEILIRLNERRDEQGLPLPQSYTMYAYCMMSNHIHLLIRERDEGIAETIKRLGIAYAATSTKNTKEAAICSKTDSGVSRWSQWNISSYCSVIFIRIQ